MSPSSRQLNVQLEQIQQAQRTSDLFIGVLGHDLRHPLSSIVSGAALLELRPGDGEDTRRKARVILGASRRMERLTQQLLDFALARVKGAIPIEPAAADLADISRQVIAELGATAVAQVHLEVVGDVNGQWDGDRMMQVVSNLMGNAVEHGSASTPVLLRLDGTEPDQVLLEVTNGGRMPAELLGSVFSPFKPRQRRSRGLGLGLHIVDQVVLAHGGRVTVTTVDPNGTCFSVRLPRKSTGSAPAHGGAEPQVP